MLLQSVEATDLKFILSNPPHPDPDPMAAAPVFELSVAEVRIKLNFPAPEIWFASSDAYDLEAKVTTLRKAGARAWITSAADLLSLSNRSTLRRFAFGERAMELVMTGPETLAIPYDWDVTAVVCRPLPRETIVRRTLRQAAKAAKPDKSHRQQARISLSEVRVPVDESFVDLYFTGGAEVHRVTIRPGTVDFSALGAAKAVIERENITALIAELTRRFARVTDDRRLERAPAPRITVLGARTLRAHLGSVDPRLKDLDDYDLMSRLAYLSGRGE